MDQTTETSRSGVDNPFIKLSSIDVRPMLSQKGNFAYLSWPFAVAELRKADPQATWEVKRWGDLPYLQCELGYFVEVAVTAFGVTLSQLHPVLDGKNRPILSPSCFDINTSIQRALVKGAALHGIGLSVYAGEDLTTFAEPTEPPAPPPAAPAHPPHRRPALKQVGSGLSSQQQEQVRKLVQDNGADMQRLLDYFQVAALKDIRATQFERVMRSLNNMRKAA